MLKKQVTRTTIAVIRKSLKTNTYAETAKLLTKKGFKTPRGGKPTTAFVNYIVSNYL